MEWKSINLSSKLSLTCGGNASYCKSVHHPIPTGEKREHPGNFQNKSVSSSFMRVSRYILFFAKLKGRGVPFLKGARRGSTLWDYPQEHLVVISVSSFVKFEIILLCFLLYFYTNKHCRTWRSMINLWIDFRTCQKWGILLPARQRSSSYLEPSKENALWEYDAVTLTMVYLKVLHDMVSQNSEIDCWLSYSFITKVK